MAASPASQCRLTNRTGFPMISTQGSDSYKIAGAERDLRRLDLPTFRRVVAGIRALAENPGP